MEHLTNYIATAERKGIQSLQFVFAKLESHTTADDGVPQLHLDQLRIVRRLMVEQKVADATQQLQRDTITPEQQEHVNNADLKHTILKKLRKLWKCKAHGETLTDAQKDYIDQVSQKQYSRSQLKKRKDIEEWKKAEFAQHGNYRKQDMFGDPIP